MINFSVETTVLTVFPGPSEYEAATQRKVFTDPAIVSRLRDGPKAATKYMRPSRGGMAMGRHLDDIGGVKGRSFHELRRRSTS